MCTNLISPCEEELHPRALDGVKLFNEGRFFEAHEALEDAWREEKASIRDLYRGILQIAVVYLHITRNNYAGAVKVYDRSQKWLRGWPGQCRGIDLEKLRADLENVMTEVTRLGSGNLHLFDRSLLRPIESDHDPA
jgi:uncharacterized protein